MKRQEDEINEKQRQEVDSQSNKTWYCLQTKKDSPGTSGRLDENRADGNEAAGFDAKRLRWLFTTQRDYPVKHCGTVDWISFALESHRCRMTGEVFVQQWTDKF